MGYAAAPKPGGAKAFRYVEATFTVPGQDINPCFGSESDDASFIGVGLGGSSTTVLGPGDEIAGVEEECTDGRLLTYTAEISAFQASGRPRVTTSFPVTPGDVVFTGVYYSSSTGEYTYNLTDESTGQQLLSAEACPAGATCGNTSAEVTSGTNLDCYAAAQFEAIKVTDSAGVSGGIADTAWQAIVGAPTYDTSTSQLYSSTSPAESAFQVNGNPNGCQP